MSTAAPPAPRIGRPRDPRRDAAIREAALSLIADVGYERTTVDAIAAAAGVSKPTIYRRWPGKHELVADALRLHPHSRATAPDTGSLRGDLVATVRQFAAHELDTAHLAAALAGRMRESEELAALVREHAIVAVRRRFGTVLDRAEARGELPGRPAVSPLFIDIAPSLIHTRVLLTGDPVDDAFADELVDRILLPILTGPKTDEHLGTVLLHA
jgi:AcrR family transcriptional regulator